MIDTIILLSGGIDSAVLLAMKHREGKRCLALSFDYGQRHKIELEYAKQIAEHYTTPLKKITIDSGLFHNSALVGNGISPPKNRTESEILNDNRPITTVPGRNTIFLSYALALAEGTGIPEIVYGPTAADLTYPDCRPRYVEAFQSLVNIVIEDIPLKIRIETPLITWDKTRIIQEGASLNVPFEKTFSCYDPPKGSHHCGRCYACHWRRKAFYTLKIADPTEYQAIDTCNSPV